MAPITRKSQSGAGVAKKVHRKRPPPSAPHHRDEVNHASLHRQGSDSWELLQQPDLQAANEDSPVEDDFMREGELEPETNGSLGLNDTVDPLREMADRIGKEVETFAVTLDSYLENLTADSSRSDFAQGLAQEFQDIANDVVEELKRSHERERLQILRQEWREQVRVPGSSNALQKSTALAERKAEHVRRLRRFQQEADIWELFRIMLETHPFEDTAEAKRQENEEKLRILGPVHRYTTEDQLYDRFLLENDLARERLAIKNWLERTADHQESSIQGIVEELEGQAGRGKGLWSAGWMHTRERIKGEKRLRTWADSNETQLPVIRRSDNNDLLVTNVDPDAPARQHRTLEKPDAYFERAVWIAVWEMLRRGMEWADICRWCEERKEGWRAVLVGAAYDEAKSVPSSEASWRHVCRLASQSGCSDEYEAAVFGLMGGSVRAAEKICRTVDDHLYAYYSAALLRQFDQYILAVSDGQPSSSLGREIAEDDLDDKDVAERAITDLILRLRKGASTKTEAVQPMKIVQSYLLADEVGSLVRTVGAAAGETARLQGPSDLITVPDQRWDQTLPETEVALDPQTLRIVAHMSIIFRILNPDVSELEGARLDENVLIAYIQALRAAGKRDLIPMYASNLDKERSVLVLSRVLADITDQLEQRQILSLLQGGYDLDVVAILNEQLRWTLDEYFPLEHDTPRPFHILESTQDTKLYPGQRMVVDFLADEETPEEDALVRSLAWFTLLKGHWQITFAALSRAVRRCLLLGRVTCALAILRNFDFETISQQKSYEVLGRAVNIMDEPDFHPSEEREALKWNLLRRQSRTYFELERLLHAIASLAVWRIEEHKYVTKTQKPSTVPGKLKKSKEAVTEAMQPLLDGILLSPVDESEASDLDMIRTTYLPEVILAFNTVLHSAGNLITRDALLESMDLGVAVARGGKSPLDSVVSAAVANGNERANNGLAAYFVQAGRMRELVRSFALTSKVMLILKAEGKPWKPSKLHKGKDLGMWEIAGGAGRRGEA